MPPAHETGFSNSKQGFPESGAHSVIMSAVARTAVCTIVARNYVALARSVLASVAQFEPAFDRFVFFIDDLAQQDAIAEGTVLRPADVFDAARYAELARGYDVVELSTAVKPNVLRHLLDRGYARVLYLDPDIQVFAPLDPLVEPLAANDIVLTPHTADAAPLNGRLRLELAHLRTGVFNLGFIGVANTPDARAMLDWWEERLLAFCRVDVSSGLFVDQRWIDLVPGLFARTAIVRHRGCNVAYWNVHDRRLAASDELRLETGEPVIFFHFSSFDPRRPDRLCNNRPRVRANEEPRLHRLLADYAARLVERGDLAARRIPYGFGRPRLKPMLRRLGRRLLFERSRRYERRA
jgi:hypothetical protein